MEGYVERGGGDWLQRAKINEHRGGGSNISNFERADFLNGPDYSLLIPNV